MKSKKNYIKYIFYEINLIDNKINKFFIVLFEIMIFFPKNMCQSNKKKRKLNLRKKKKNRNTDKK